MSVLLLGMNAKNGSWLSGIDHVRQSLADILTTPIGSRVMRRNYGSLLPTLIDQPLNDTTILRIYAATAAAVKMWEPRIQLNGVQLERGEDRKIILILDGIVNAQSVQLPIGIHA